MQLNAARRLEGKKKAKLPADRERKRRGWVTLLNPDEILCGLIASLLSNHRHWPRDWRSWRSEDEIEKGGKKKKLETYGAQFSPRK